ncbi:hypothetical protein BJN34_33965 [Cupriavidus necator]|uniref:Uncharacterized protein n=1 Tax=Cupriavidus necator TaxID=106590 RepID=A0A1U9V1N9_CUPNE|nr:hypothetical protein BJN34_33965 [Cupriavidus necator]
MTAIRKWPARYTRAGAAGPGGNPAQAALPPGIEAQTAGMQMNDTLGCQDTDMAMRAVTA